MPKITSCYLCNSGSQELPWTTRDIKSIHARECSKCGLIFLDSHDHIDSEYYRENYDSETFKDEGMDWSKYLQVCEDDDKRRASWLRRHTSGEKILDIGTGAGGLLLKLKADYNVAGVEPMRSWHKELKRENIPIFATIEEAPKKNFDVVSLFHVLEHATDPISLLRDAADRLLPGGTLVVEVPNADDALASLFKSDAFLNFTHWSPHLYCFSEKTLERVFVNAGFPNVSMTQIQRYPLSNHLHWLSKGLPGGHTHWNFLNNDGISQQYEKTLRDIGKCDTIIAVAKATPEN